MTASVEIEPVAPPSSAHPAVPVSAVPAAAAPTAPPTVLPATPEAGAAALGYAPQSYEVPGPASVGPRSVPPPSAGPASRAPASLSPGSLPPSLAPSDLMAPSLEQALRQRVRVGNGAGPLWAFLVIGVVASLGVVALVSALFSSIIARSTAPTVEPRSSAPASASAPSIPEPVAPAPAPRAPVPPPPALSLLERAAQGEPDAVREIEKQPEAERSIEQVSALAAGRAEDKKRTLRALPGRAEKDAVFASSAELARDLRTAVGDPDTSRTAVTVMAQLPGSLGPDLLYATWSSRKKGDPAGELAEQLLRTEVVRKKASAALLVALDLRAAEKCEAAKDALARAVEHGDRRAMSAMARFRSKTGCGDLKTEDCFDCLRDGDELKNASRAVAKRPPPRW